MSCFGRGRRRGRQNVSKGGTAAADEENYRKLIRSLATKYASLRDCRGR